MAKSAQLEREIAASLRGGTTKDEVIARRKTADGKEVALWCDGSLTWGRIGTVIKGSPHARTEQGRREALAAGWLVMGEAELYNADEITKLIASARKTASKGGDPGDVRKDFTKSTPLRPLWTVLETDRGGRPKLRVWRLPRISHPGMAVWDHMNVSGRGRYHVMQEMRERGRGANTYAPTGIEFNDLDALARYLRETSQVAEYRDR